MSARVRLVAMPRFIAAGAGFLLAVLWFDLMFDVQALRSGRDAVPEAALASITAYYRRVTTSSRPMNRLIAVVMVGTVVAVAVQLIRDDVPRWVSAVSVATAVVPIGLAGFRTVPSAVRLGSRRDPVTVQSALAHSVLRDHLVCTVFIVALLVTQLGWA
jgi:hypothetical protein